MRLYLTRWNKELFALRCQNGVQIYYFGAETEEKFDIL